ncbi:MAG TPA: UpxY family transcription antiterminator [Candidatus Dormibacteraeota bacterium]|nr:UpxY family transcription antiterminator [Candidatus Dormibacteraeota bacterium]
MSTVGYIESHRLESPSLDPLCATRPATATLPAAVTRTAAEDSWYAVYTVHRHESSVLRHLDVRAIESFLPTYEVTRLWRNRQRVKVAVPLFPDYVFVKAGNREFIRVLQCPGVVKLIGTARGPLPIDDSVIELLRVGVAERKIEPYRELVIGNRVRVKNGLMRGVEGVLIRKDNDWRFVLSIDSINQHAAIKMEADNLEPVAVS